MNRQDLQLFWGLQIFAIVWAAGLFALLPSRPLAGALAGLYFLGSGLFMLYRVRRWTAPWKSLTLYALLVHVFLISIPLLLVRYLNRGVDFSSLHIFGIAGPTFHRVSTVVFFALILATWIDWLRVRRTAQPKQEI